MPNFVDVLDAPLDDAKPPVPLPAGTYTFLINGPFTIKEGPGKDGKDAWKVAEFPARPIAAGPDVDQETLAAAGWPTDKTLRYSVFLSGENSAYFFREQAKNIFGVDTTGQTFKQALSMLQGRQFMATVTHVPNKDGTGFFAQINERSLAKV